MKPQVLISMLDKTTVDGLAEALLIAMMSLRDDENRVLWVRFDHDAARNIQYAKEVAAMLLKGTE
jgi:hypothetical protein